MRGASTPSQTKQIKRRNKMTNLLLSTIVFPNDGNLIEGFVYTLLEWIMGWGAINYGFAIIIFTVIIKLIMLPLDFMNRYFTKKNQVSMQKIAPEEKLLRETYADDPMALQRAKQKLYQEQGVSQGGFCLVMLINLFLSVYIFCFVVFPCLRTVANYNIREQVEGENGLLSVYTQYKGTDELETKLNEKYEETRVSFLWVKSIWRADTWEKETMPYEKYKETLNKLGTTISADDYNAIFNIIKEKHNGWGGLHWNGMLLLVVLSGGVTYLSTWLSMKMNKKNTPQKVGTKTEPIISYSLRDAKSMSAGNGQPEIDPAQINKIMGIVMPIVMISWAVSSTTAMSIYIIASSFMSTILTLSLGFAVDAIIKHQKPKAIKGKDFDPTVINPHAKYFKSKGSK
jgi:YidC/Oxa1 family membrane protein insertase